MDKETKKQFELLNKRLGGMSTKEDLKSLATKAELKGLSTKEDLKGLATKDELGKIKTFLYKEMPTKEEMDKRFEAIPTKENFNLLQTSVDAYAKQSKDYYQEVTVVVAKVNRIEAWIKTASAKIGIEYKV